MEKGREAETVRTTIERTRDSDVPTDAHNDHPDGDGNRKLVVTLGPEAAAATRRMAGRLNVTAPEAVRRGLMLLDLLLSLDSGEELVVRDSKGEIERLRFHWGY